MNAARVLPYHRPTATPAPSPATEMWEAFAMSVIGSWVANKLHRLRPPRFRLPRLRRRARARRPPAAPALGIRPAATDDFVDDLLRHPAAIEGLGAYLRRLAGQSADGKIRLAGVVAWFDTGPQPTGNVTVRVGDWSYTSNTTASAFKVAMALDLLERAEHVVVEQRAANGARYRLTAAGVEADLGTTFVPGEALEDLIPR